MSVQTFGKRGLVDAPRPSVIENSSPRDESLINEAAGKWTSTPAVTVAIAFGLIVIFAFEYKCAFDLGKGATLSPDSLIAFGGASYDLVIGSKEVWRLFVAPLLHASTNHLIGNLFALVLIGWRLETLVGHAWFAAIFVASALAGSTTSMIFNPHEIVGVGASGAIIGLLAALLVLCCNPKFDKAKRKIVLRRAAIFGWPALAPLFFGGGSFGVDYFAHLGGALCGGAIGWRLSKAWAEDSLLSASAAKAGRWALAALGASIVSSFFIFGQYPALEANSKAIIPAADFAQAAKMSSQRAAEILAAYPDDPRAHLLLALAKSRDQDLSDAEENLRLAMVQKWPQRPSAERAQQLFAQATLAVLLSDEHRANEALQLARAPCGERRLGPIRTLLTDRKLCASPQDAEREPNIE